MSRDWSQSVLYYNVPIYRPRVAGWKVRDPYKLCQSTEQGETAAGEGALLSAGMIVRGGEGFLGANWGLGQYKLLIQTVSGRSAAVEIESLVEICFLPYSVLQAWLQ